MTHRANLLTEHASGPATGATGPPTEQSSSLRAYVGALERLGFDGAALLTLAGIRRAELDDADARIACSAIGAVVRHAMGQRRLDNLGMRMALETPIGAFPLIDYLVLTSDTVGSGLEQLARYFRLVVSVVAIRLEEDGNDVRVVFDGPPDPLQYEFGITLCVRHLHAETEGGFRPEYVSLAYLPDDLAELEGALGCPVRAHASWNGWGMTRSSAALALRRRDPVLGGVLREHASEILARHPLGTGVMLQVREAVVSRLSSGGLRVEAIARALAMSVRSLQRRLAEEGCSFQDVVDDIRRQAAQRYLRDPRLSTSEVAFLLGYSETAAFHRAFKRWSGVTPQAFRQSGARTS